MENVTPWIEHLSKPLVLAGFVLFVLAGLVKVLKPEKLSSKATERLMNQGIIFSFILGFVIVLSAFAYAFMQMQANKAVVTPVSVIHQDTIGNQSPAIKSDGDVNVNFSNHPLSKQKKAIQDAHPPSDEQPPSMQQQTQGEQSPAIHSKGDVNIQY